ncbi:hypothetical protein [Heyndrickxia ginsengihumi]|uniref:hypothetical protein n=1 Tax=Heyndrickxia ginsengihumi TaxID=363870 RepID=UPI00046EDF2B|nr:hypothetical protein [Heyndrickxia ginsengihumi]
MRDLTIVGNKRNKTTGIFLITVASLFVIFFSSKLFLPDATPINQTPIGTKITGLTNTELTLAKWEYSKKKKLMEVTFQYSNKLSDTDDESTRLTFSASNDDYTEKYPTSIVYHDDNSYVVQIKNVPNDYKNIDLKIDEHIKDSEFAVKNGSNNIQFDPTGKVIDDDTTYDDQSDDSSNNNETVHSTDVYTDYRKTQINNKLVSKSNKQYQLELLALQIKNNEKDIQTVENANKKINNNIEKIEGQISKLEDSKKYKTSVEKESVDSQISSLKNNITDYKNAIKENNSYISQLKDKNSLLKNQQKDNELDGLK